MKSPMLLWKWVADESATLCCTCATRDINYVTRRYEHEGMSFLTISLPSFGKDFEKSLDLKRADRNLFQGFPWQAGLPRFLGGFLDLVFDRSSGVLLREPSIDAISSIRQLTLMFGKILLPCSNARLKKAMDGYMECERDVRVSDSMISDLNWSDFVRVGNLLFRDAFQRVDREIHDNELIPKHGPGATADKLRGNAKFSQLTWPRRLETLFPFGEFALPNWKYFDEMSKVDILEPRDEIPAKVISVPKTLKTPRIIAIEPTAMQYSQQALARSILESLRDIDYLDAMLGFRDQTPNQRMAQTGSREGNLATLDLSEASDRVSNEHVRHLTALFPHLHAGLEATRSQKAHVDGHGVVRLAKYASMGSALCFPLEAMVFLTMIFLGIEQALNTPLSRKLIHQFVGSVRVYGDDIIVPVDCVPHVIGSLESFGIRVNTNKSFWNGKFRESCGKEFYDGHDVSIVRVRRELPSSRERVAEVISLVSFRNQLYEHGYWKTCEALDEMIRTMIKHYPVVLPSSPVVGRHSFLGYSVERMNGDTHSPLVRGYVVSAKPPKDPLDGHGALLKCLLMLEQRYGSNSLGNAATEYSVFPTIDEVGGLPAVNAEHLERAGRPHAVALKLRWESPF
uniref:RNA-directed RNA polymerase n=1 Tax=Leviviridae sp. TaxID=2027243 RepID=A0A514DCM4_9VIRU|nr:MAG: RNA-dependent RNA polymerase [Leviviridae sp.]